MMKSVGLFAGIGGIELGLNNNGFQTELFCEILKGAQFVLRKNFPDIPVHDDIVTLASIPKVDLLAAGFPCQDLSIAGKKDGITGINSSLVSHVFRLVKKAARDSPNYILIENVPNLLALNKGEAIKYIIESVADLGYNWAYRIVDPRGFGIPQRRPRLIFLASKISHPKEILFSKDENIDAFIDDRVNTAQDANYGFYWTEGRIGIGWAKDSIPPIKGGSNLGIPSPPGVWIREKNFFGTPSINDAERLQGFPEGWTDAMTKNGLKDSHRWKLIGNAVNVKVSDWVGRQIVKGDSNGPDPQSIYLFKNGKWPKAAFNDKGKIFGVNASLFPENNKLIPIDEFIKHSLKPLSVKAVSGFYKRVQESTLIKYTDEFTTSLEAYITNYANEYS